MLLGPETPGISPDTPDLEHSGENSGYRPGNSGLGSPDALVNSPDTPDLSVDCRLIKICGQPRDYGYSSRYSGFWGMFLVRE